MESAEHSTDRAIRARQPAYRRIAEGLRNEILAGKFAQGTQLPSTPELATLWHSSYFTIHTALMTLVKEGWLERRHGAGTYVADLRARFLCAGIYRNVDIGSDTRTGADFRRGLHFSLLKEFARLGKETQLFVDTRPINRQQDIFPPLIEAIRNRRIQCLAVPTVIPDHLRELMKKLALPTAFLVDQPNQIVLDDEGMVREGVRRMRKQGCRTVGLISNKPESNTLKNPIDTELFLKVVRSEEMTTQREWILKPDQELTDPIHFGYTQFRKLWSLREKPDGLFVWPDEVARGSIMAILALGVRVPQDMQFVFHRNAHIPLPCPFPVTWAIMDEDVMAQGFIRLLDDQFDGKKFCPVLVPYRFEKDEALQWK
jgi:DNA-binding LacI/PurR family transcriptional regulator